MRKSYTAIFSAIAFLCLVFILPDSRLNASGPDIVNARLTGLARTSVALASGQDAIGINPANIAIDDHYRFSISILPVGVIAGSDFINYDLYSRYFTGRTDPITGDRKPYYLTLSDKQYILDTFPGRTAGTGFQLQSRLFGITYRHNTLGGLAFSITGHGGMQFDLPIDYMRFLLIGLEETGSSYNFSQTNLHAWAYTEYSLSYGSQRIRLYPFRIWMHYGIGVKFVDAYFYFDTDRYTVYFSNGTVPEGFILRGRVNINARSSSVYDFNGGNDNGSFSPFRSSAGTGWGLDLGLRLEFPGGINIGAGLTDIGMIQWSRNTTAYKNRGSFVFDDVYVEEQRDSLMEVFTGETIDISPFSSPLPTALRIGISWELDESLLGSYIPGSLIAGIEYYQGFTEQFGSTFIPRMSAGAEWRPVHMLPIRTGFSVGGKNLFNWAFGLGLNFRHFDIEVATENIGMIFMPYRTKYASVTVGTRFYF